MLEKIKTIKQKFGIVGNSTPLNHAIEVAVQVAPTDMTVLISGESGTGKESFSKIIHSISKRKHGQFIAVNCGAIPEGTIQSCSVMKKDHLQEQMNQEKDISRLQIKEQFF